jgi:glutaredoxin
MTTVYGSKGCAPCVTIRYWLDKKGHPYEYKDINEHREEVSQYTSVVSPPVVIKDGQMATNLKDLVKLYGVI